MYRSISLLTSVLAFLLLFSLPLHSQEGAEEKNKDAAAAAPADGSATAEEPAAAEEKEDDKSPFKSGTFSGLKLRGIGPALMSGRIVDIAVDPSHRSTWYIAVACGGVWKTTNAGTTWKPIFDRQSSYSIGCVTVDGRNPNIVWVGSGENNSQRSVGYGDGVYKSVDGGGSWKKMGLENSEHIGKILVDPRDSDVVFVAAQGPLWNPGGDRGLYKTCDGGATWEKVLEISENTGVSDIVFDPRDPDVIYASSYQRRRHVWTLINGGPEAAVHKSTDGGATWNKLKGGLPGGDVGRIALAVSHQNPDVVYALVEASGKSAGFYRSANRGATWAKQSGYKCTSGQYYSEIFACPHVFDRIYSMDTRMKVSHDGGKTFVNVGESKKHVDNHALVFDPCDPEYLLAGCDGGLYESFDRGKTWKFFSNLPLTQFYKVCVDNDTPFYNVYGGTQDNNTQGGPSRTIESRGIANGDWFITLGGDGFEPQVDPTDPNIVYSQLQHGVLVRFDRTNGERVSIQPQPAPGEDPLRWNWDAALMISPHSHKRLYFCAQRVFRSDDRGDSWTAISGDLTRQIDRNTLDVMGRVWGIDAVDKNDSTSFYGNIVAITESPKVEGLIYIGTDDGLVQVTEDGGANWRKIETFPDVPEMSYVSDLEASQHDPNRVYALFNNHKMGDFKPYVLRSDDRALTWTPVTGDLPERGSVWALCEDHVREELLFCGTEFGLFFTVDGGAKWVQLKGGLPTIALRDIEIQRRENDLVCASFGRSFYILDDYTPLRYVSDEMLEQEAELFPVKEALMYIPARRDSGSQGHLYYTAPNPPVGATFTYYIKEGYKTLKAERKEEEKKIAKEGGDVFYPTWDALRAEEREESPQIIFTITDEAGNVVNRITGSASSGIHRVTWNMRYPSSRPTSLGSGGESGRWRGYSPSGPMVAPGVYTVAMEQWAGGELTPLATPRSFVCVPLGISSLPEPDRAAALAFQEKAARLQRAMLGASNVLGEAETRIAHVIKALDATPKADRSLTDRARALKERILDLKVELNGDRTVGRYNEPTPPSLMSRISRAVSGPSSVLCSPPTAIARESYAIAADAFGPLLERIRTLVEVDLKALEDALEAAGGPWTPGRIPKWEKE